MKKLVIAGLTAAVIPFAAMAGTVTDDFNISVTVVEYCQMGTEANDISFSYNPLTNEYEGTTSTSTDIQCVNGTTYTVDVPSTVNLTDADGRTITAKITTTINDEQNEDGQFVSTGNSTINYEVAIDTTAENQYMANSEYTGTVNVTITY